MTDLLENLPFTKTFTTCSIFHKLSQNELFYSLERPLQPGFRTLILANRIFDYLSLLIRTLIPSHHEFHYLSSIFRALIPAKLKFHYLS